MLDRQNLKSPPLPKRFLKNPQNPLDTSRIGRILQNQQKFQIFPTIARNPIILKNSIKPESPQEYHGNLRILKDPQEKRDSSRNPCKIENPQQSSRITKIIKNPKKSQESSRIPQKPEKPRESSKSSRVVKNSLKTQESSKIPQKHENPQRSPGNPIIHENPQETR